MGTHANTSSRTQIGSGRIRDAIDDEVVDELIGTAIGVDRSHLNSSDELRLFWGCCSDRHAGWCAAVWHNQGVMSAPKHVPVATVGAFRPDTALPPADAWLADRPSELAADAVAGRRSGRPGPDQGYGLKLANSFHGRLHLEAGEHEHDVIAGCLPVGLKRAALYGRAPVIHDFEMAFGLFGYLDPNPAADLVDWRRGLFAAAGHHYEVQRAIADTVPDATLRMPRSGQARSAWRELLVTA